VAGIETSSKEIRRRGDTEKFRRQEDSMEKCCIKGSGVWVDNANLKKSRKVN
jgi:hypothetical protein